MKAVLLDTGVIVALLDQSERTHQLCVNTVRGMVAPLVTCEAVITESCYLLRGLAGAPEAVIENVRGRIFQIPFQLSQDSQGVKSILRKYRDREIDLADACLIRLAEIMGSGQILTLDKDFSVYRWGRNKPFHVLPEPI